MRAFGAILLGLFFMFCSAMFAWSAVLTQRAPWLSVALLMVAIGTMIQAVGVIYNTMEG